MSKKLLLLFAFVILLASKSVWAQQTTIAVPEQGDRPAAISIFFDGENTLGIVPENITKENMSRYNLREPRGVAITRVIEGGPAERAGLKKDDVILRFDAEPVTSVRKLQRLIGEAQPEHTVRLTISRGGAEQEVSVTLGKRQDFPRLLEGAVLPQADELRRHAEEMKKHGEELKGLFGKIPQGQGALVMGFGTGRRIGATTTQLTEQLAEYFGVTEKSGLLVTSIIENSPAAKAGLKAGDVITEVDGTKIKSHRDLTGAINRKDEGEITLTIVRDKRPRTIKLTPERRQGFSFDHLETLTVPHIATSKFPRMNFRMAPLKIAPLTLPRLKVNPNLKPLRLQPPIL